MITENSTRFDAVWPGVFQRAVKGLERRGVIRVAAEDAVQEAGARAIAGDLPFRDSEDLLRWVQTVAWRVALDSRKHDRRLVYEVPDERSAEDVGRAVEQRMRLQRFRALWRELTPDERETLTATASGADRRSSVRLAVRRHRVRLKLLAMLDGAATLLALARKVVDANHRRRVGVVAAPAVVMATMLTTASLIHSGPADLPRVRRIQAPVAGSIPKRTLDAAVIARGALRTPAVNGGAAHGAAPLPKMQVPYARPGGNGHVYGRPKEADDHFVCLALNGVPPRCADLPIRITD